MAVFMLQFTVLTVVADVLRGSELLNAVPSDAVGFIHARNLDDLAVQVDRLRANAFPNAHWRLDTTELETVFGLAPGTIDASQPIIIIFDSLPEIKSLLQSGGMSGDTPRWPIIGFHPKHIKNFDLRDKGRVMMGAYHGPYGRLGALQTDSIAFVSAVPKRRALRSSARALQYSTERMPLSDSARRSIEGADLSFHLDLSDLRGQYMQQLKPIAMLIRLSAVQRVTDPDQYAEAFAMVNWMTEGAVDAIQQLNALSVCLSLEPEYIRLRHIQSFDSDGWFSNYLASVKKSDFDRFSIIEDRPFMIAGSVDWSMNAERAFTYNLIKTAQSAAKSESPKILKENKRALADVKTLCERSSGQEFCVRTSNDARASVQIIGSNIVSDAESYYAAHRRVQDYTNRLMANIIPGSGAISSGTLEQRDGRPVYLVPFSSSEMPEDVRRNVELVYGENAAYQETVRPPNHVVYSVAPREVGLKGIIFDEGKSLAENETIRSAIARMATEANIVAMVDLSRFADAIPRFVRASQTATMEGSRLLDLPPVGTAAQDSVGPLLCWTGTAQRGSFAGEFILTHADLRESTRIAANIGAALSQSTSESATDEGR